MMAASVVGGLAFAPAVLSQQAGTKKPAAANAPAAENQGAARGQRRLPAFFARVVTQDQREKIYEVQAKYQDQIDALEAQLKAIIDKRNAEIEGLLTPEQREQLTKLREEASQRSAAKKQPAAGEAPAVPATPGAAARPASPAPATAKKSSGN